MFRVLAKPTIILNASRKIPTKINAAACRFSTDFLDCAVSSKYSYAFGRGTSPLIYENVNFFLDKIAKGPKNDLLISYHENKNISNHQFVEDVRRLASGLFFKLGLRKGDTICLWSLNCYDWIRIFFACQSLGITVCTVNPYYKEQELAYALIKCKAKAIFLPGSESEQHKITKFVNIFNSNHVQTKLKQNGHINNVVFIDENRAETSFDYSTFQLEQLSSDSKLSDEQLESAEGDDASVIMYTSGTTGVPKAVVTSMFSVINNANIISQYVPSESHDAIMLPIPLFHSFALVCGAQVMACNNVRMILSGYRYNVKDVVDSMAKHNATFLMSTPTMLIDIVHYVKANDVQLPHLKSLIAGAASFPAELGKFASDAIPSLEDIRIGYGMTETSPVATMSRKTDTFEQKTQTVGQPIDYVELKIVDPNNGRIVKLGEEGELLVRGHNLMTCYFEDEERTKETITPNRWLKTGDRATMDQQGYVKICGRTKEMIIKGGENIYPAEIENILQSHPNVLDAYVFSMPDERLGEVVGTWVKLDDLTIGTTEDDIKEYCKSMITSYKVPSYVMFVDDFPMTSTGKVMKYEMTRVTCEKLDIPYKAK